MTELDYKIQDEVIKIADELKVTPSQVAINWMMNRSPIHSCLIGPRTYDHFVDNMKALDFQLSKDQIQTLDKISEEAIKPIFPRTMISNNYKTVNALYWLSDKKYAIE
jgi:aryl-alcohol dehydrogenase-like predicted oxidoreductase